MAMFSFPAADFDVDYRDVAAQKRLLRERMAGLGWLTPRILAHLDDTPDFYLDQVAQVVMDRWSSGRVGLLGDAAFSSSPMSGGAPGWPWSAPTCWPESWPPPGGTRRPGSPATSGGCARSSRPTRRSAGCTPAASTSPGRTPSRARSPTWRVTELVERAINGVELPDYAGVPDSGAPAGPPTVPKPGRRAPTSPASRI
jgi:hypothetical protein